MTFPHWPKLGTLFATQAWISLWHLPNARASKTAALSIRYLGSESFIGSNGILVSSFKQRRGST